MIDKSSNIIRDPKIKRVVEYSVDNKQVNVLDQRFYKRHGKYYPSISSILNYFPKNQFFHSWLKDVGHNSEIISQKAAWEGTQVHNAIEYFLDGNELSWIDDKGVAKYNLDVWRMILKFADFWNTNQPELIATEYHLFSDKHEYAGTADIICRLNGKIHLLDIKTSNSIHSSYNLQLAAYANAWNETHNEKVEDTGIIWLKASTRGPGKNGKQGNGWQLKQIGGIEYYFNMFKNIYEIYKMENPDSKPYIETLPTVVKITDEPTQMIPSIANKRGRKKKE
jgi:hypothetical protein